MCVKSATLTLHCEKSEVSQYKTRFNIPLESCQLSIKWVGEADFSGALDCAVTVVVLD